MICLVGFFGVLVSRIFDVLCFRCSGVLFQIKEALKPDGVFLGALCGGDTLFELRLENPIYFYS